MMKRIVVFVLILTMFNCKNGIFSESRKGAMIETALHRNVYEDSGESNVSVDEYLRYTGNVESGLFVSKQVGQIRFGMSYQPNEVIALRNSMFQTNKDTVLYRKEVRELGNMQYFVFSIAIPEFNQEILKYGLTNEADYESRVNYFAFGIQQDFSLIEGKDTLGCLLFHFERNYGVVPQTNFLLAFERPENGEEIYDKVMSFDDRIFGTGKVYLRVKKENIVRIPMLNI